jgi:hypothetical protein
MLGSIVTLLIALPCFLLATASDASAGPSAERRRLTEVSLRDGLGAREVPLLQVVPLEGDRDAQLSRLLQFGRLVEQLARSPDPRVHVRNPGRLSVSARSTVLFAADQSWYVEVMGDGSRFRYHGNIDDPDAERAAGDAGPLDLATLERLGRDFIATRLARVVPPAEGERLVFLGSRYLREGSAIEREGFTSTVKANIAIFGREVGGVFVAGPGSKISVWFSNDRQPVAFLADWPIYRRSNRAQATLDINGIRDRILNYADKPRDLIQRNLTQFECGYVDLGVFKRRMGTIQSGCVGLHRGDIEDFRYGAIETIPIGVTVVPDPDWPVTTFIAAGDRWDPCRISKMVCNEPPPTAAPAERSLGGPDTRRE